MKFTAEQLEFLTKAVTLGLDDNGNIAIVSVNTHVLCSVHKGVGGDVIGDINGDVMGDVVGDIAGYVQGDIFGSVLGSIRGSVRGGICVG